MLPLVAIIGPTATGKTALAEYIALTYNGELVSCDAKQVYRGMDIGTNKELELTVPQHLIDIKEPGERVSVAEYQALAYDVIDDIHTRGKLPVLVGGSMMYAEAVINGYQFSKNSKSKKQVPRYKVLKISPLVPRGEIKEKIKDRTVLWLEQGLLEEIKSLLQGGVSPAWLKSCGLEYRYFTEYVLGEITLEQAIEKANTSQAQYVKRQETWWRRHNDIHKTTSQDQAGQLIGEFLKNV